MNRANSGVVAFAIAVLASLPLWAGDPNPSSDKAKFADAPALDAEKFAILASTESGGHTIYRVVGKAGSVEEVIGAVVDPLAKVFADKPTLSGGYVDSKTKKTGGCTFSVKHNGQPVRGWVFAGINDAGVGIASIIYGPADISKPEMAQLLAALPARPKMIRHDFPDQSGSIDLPDGWTTKNQSLADFPLIVNGPAGQIITEGGHVLIETPDGSLATLTMKNYQSRVARYQQALRNSQQLGRPVPAALNPGPPPDLNRDTPQLIFCRYCSTPQEIMQYLNPIVVEKMKRRNLPWFEVETVFTIAPLPAEIGGTAFGVYLLNNRHEGDRVIKIRSLQRLEIMPVGPTGEWSYWVNNTAAPEATFNQDVLVMNDIVNSIKVNDAVVSQKINARAAAASKLLHDQFEAFQETMKKNHEQFEQNQRETFDRNQAAIAAQEKAVHDSSSDMIEYCLGVRDVYDRSTGKMASVDLFNSHAITQGLNDAANDPNRFVEIPLRYER